MRPLNKKLLAAILVTLAFAGIVSAHPEVTPKHDFEYACAYMVIFYGASCEGIKRPVIFYAPMSSGLGGLYYPRPGFIFINGLGVSWASQRELIFHETIHHIHYKNFGYKKCDSEEAARRATDTFMGRPYNDRWRERYKC